MDTPEQRAARRERSRERSLAEIARLGMTIEDRGIHHDAGYFCLECWNHECELNAHDRCRDCADGEAIGVWCND